MRSGSKASQACFSSRKKLRKPPSSFWPPNLLTSPPNTVQTTTSGDWRGPSRRDNSIHRHYFQPPRSTPLNRTRSLCAHTDSSTKSHTNCARTRGELCAPVRTSPNPPEALSTNRSPTANSQRPQNHPHASQYPPTFAPPPRAAPRVSPSATHQPRSKIRNLWN